jgi:hypothetical protein
VWSRWRGCESRWRGWDGYLPPYLVVSAPGVGQPGAERRGLNVELWLPTSNDQRIGAGRDVQLGAQ